MTILKSSKNLNEVILPYIQEKLGESVNKISETSNQIILQIPKPSQHKFSQFFSQFDEDLSGLEITSYEI